MNEKLKLFQQEVGKTVIGNETAVSGLFTAVLAGGHVLVEAAPGSGKTSLLLTAAKAMGLDYSRIGLTQDTMDADVLGTVVQDNGKIRYRKGAVYTNLFIAENLDRASGTVRSIVTDIMEDGKLLVGGRPIPLPAPFITAATIEAEYGKYDQLSPEEKDRFMVRLPMAYLSGKDNMSMMRRRTSEQAPPPEISAVMTAQDIVDMKAEAEAVAVPDQVLKYISDLVKASRAHSAVAQGITPRGAMDISTMARTRAYIMGRTEASAEDVRAVLGMTAGHRMQIIPQARAFGESEDSVVTDLLKKVKAPREENAKTGSKKGGHRE